MLKSVFNKVGGLKVCIFIKKETLIQVISCEYCEILKNTSFYRTPPLHYTFPKSYVMIEFFGCIWIQNWHFSYFLCHCFVFLHNSIRISVPWLFSTCFHTKIFSKFNFRAHYNVGSSTILIESLKFTNNSRITVTSLCNLLWKLWIWVFWILSFVNIFL